MTHHRRVILNFAHQCALHCPWCYVPFVSRPAREGTVGAVIDRISELGYTTLTVGGGDPFQYSFIGRVLKRAKKLGLFVHVDTHGRSLRPTVANYSLMEGSVDLIGLPLDGPNPSTHDGMRNSPGHFDVVRRRLDWLNNIDVNVKINTLVARSNINSIMQLGELIRAIAPSRWSLYQYWPVGPAAAVHLEHDIEAVSFLEVANTVADRLAATSTVVEVCPRDRRRATYPIVHHDGSVFVHDSSPRDSFRFLGSLFSGDILDVVASACGSDRPEAAERYL